MQRFGLLWRLNQHAPWQTLLPELERPRLKTARAVAYTQAAEQGLAPVMLVEPK